MLSATQRTHFASRPLSHFPVHTPNRAGPSISQDSFMARTNSAKAASENTFAASTAAISRLTERSPDGLKTWGQLSPAQQGMFGADGRAGYEGLDTKQRGVFLVLSERLEANGISLDGLELAGGASGVHGNMLRFELAFDPKSAALLKERVDAAVANGKMFDEKPSATFHKGYLDSGVREERAKYALQIGFGEKGAFVDMDRYNPSRGGKLNYWRHLAEIAFPGNIDPKKVGQELGIDIFA